MPAHRILLNFQHGNGGWWVSFLEDDCRTSLPLKLTFRSEDKIREMFNRVAASRVSEDRAMLEHGLEIGRGGFWLMLNEGQYQKLKAKCRL
jgi:hypothetical protein